MKVFRHDTNERNKSNVLKLRMKLGAAGYGIYMMLLERLASEPMLRAELDYDVLAYDFHESPDLIRQVVEDFDLFIINLENDTFSNEELINQQSGKAKCARQEKLLDEYIRQRLSDPKWVNSLATTHRTSHERVRALVKQTFREKVLSDLSSLPVNPSSLNFCGILNSVISSTFKQ